MDSLHWIPCPCTPRRRKAEPTRLRLYSPATSRPDNISTPNTGVLSIERWRGKCQSQILETAVRNITVNHSKAAPPLGSLIRSWFDEGLLEGKAEGIAAGIAAGEAKGKAEGKVEERYQIAKKLLLKNMSIEEIADITGLSVDEIRGFAEKI